MPRLLCFIGDTLNTLVSKGEIKERYYNPANFFREVHFITRGVEDISFERIQIAVGMATGNINTIRRERMCSLDLNPLLTPYQQDIDRIVEKVKPDVIRAYDPLISGLLAVRAGQRFGIPVMLSVHTDMDDMRKHYRYVYHDYRKYLISLLISRQIERFVISHVNSVIGVYRIAVDYARRYGAQDTRIIYNKVPVDRFKPSEDVSRKSEKPQLIYVGNFIPGKNQITLIQAMTYLNAKLLLIGSGPELETCKELVRTLSIEEKVDFIESIPNGILHQYYQSADIFVSATTYGETAIPVLEAMACGLPCVVAEPLFSGPRDLIGGTALTPRNDPRSIAEAVNKLLSNIKLREKIGIKGRELMLRYSGEKMEMMEVEEYQLLLNSTPCKGKALL